ncbi:unnamed protein product [Chrysoparadoxa australica]
MPSFFVVLLLFCYNTSAFGLSQPVALKVPSSGTLLLYVRHTAACLPPEQVEAQAGKDYAFLLKQEASPAQLAVLLDWLGNDATTKDPRTFTFPPSIPIAELFFVPTKKGRWWRPPSGWTAHRRVKRALRQSNPVASAASNPLSRPFLLDVLGDGACDLMRLEAQSLDEAAWQAWNGDESERCRVVGLDKLPESARLWEEARLNIERELALAFRVEAVTVTDVLMCAVQGMGQKEVAEDRVALAAVSADSSRCRSLLTFSVCLGGDGDGDGDAGGLSIMLEQQGVLLQWPAQGQAGMGIAFCGKLLHAHLNRGTVESLCLRCFADVKDKRLHQDVKEWRWGSPPFHTKARWVDDSAILSRIWAVNPTLGPASGLESYRMDKPEVHRYYKQGAEVWGSEAVPEVVLEADESQGKEVTILAFAAPPPGTGAELTQSKGSSKNHRMLVGRAGLVLEGGSSEEMDRALKKLQLHTLGLKQGLGDGDAEDVTGALVAPIRYVYVDPRYRGFGLGRRLFLAAMAYLKEHGFNFAVIIVEDTGSGGLFGFYKRMGYIDTSEELGLPRSMVAPLNDLPSC